MQKIAKPGSDEKKENSLRERSLQRLVARRWLLVVVASIIFFFVLLSKLPYEVAFLGFFVIILSAALLPRQDNLRPAHSNLPDLGSEAEQKLGPEAFQAFVNALPDPAIMLNANGTLLHFNKMAEDLWGGITTDQHVSSLIRDPDFLEAVSQAPKRVNPVNIIYSERVPVERHILAIVSMLEGMGNEIHVPAILVSLRDLTEQERLDKMRADFIANASHELRTPLASLLGFIETLQGAAKNDDAARERFLDIMAKQAQRMTRLIDDLLSLSRVEMKAHVLPSGEVEINEAVAYVAASLEPLASEQGTSLKVETLNDESWVRGDRDELVQVFQNLIQNALKYGPSGGNVTVRVLRDNGNVAISVQDDGPGIAPEHLPRITERFYRVDVESSREKGGTGLGLAIAKNIVNRHRGELGVTSVLGQGSTFTVTLQELKGTSNHDS